MVDVELHRTEVQNGDPLRLMNAASCSHMNQNFSSMLWLQQLDRKRRSASQRPSGFSEHRHMHIDGRLDPPLSTRSHVAHGSFKSVSAVGPSAHRPVADITRYNRVQHLYDPSLLGVFFVSLHLLPPTEPLRRQRVGFLDGGPQWTDKANEPTAAD